jgi:hydrogenase-1 operon protein HyaF
MESFPIPVRVIGPGSQEEDDTLQYLEMPRGMNTFRMPRVPEKVDPAALEDARDLFAAFLGHLEQWNPEADPNGPRLDLAGLDAAALKIANEMLGEGEVSIRIDGPRPIRIQESVFTGVWRVCEFDGEGRQIGDMLEAAAIPQSVVAAARAGAQPVLPRVELPPGAMNSPALLREIEAHIGTRQPGAPAHVVNLTLFPMSPEDHAVLERALPVGPVAVISHGFGNCRITSTGARDVWRVQYFNNMNTLILNTIEVILVPEVALAAAEDLIDSRTRLAELVDWMSEDCAT